MPTTPFLATKKCQGTSFTSIEMFHTLTPRSSRAFEAPTNEMNVEMKGKCWWWMGWQITQPGHETGNAEETGKKKRNTNTNAPSPERANPERAREKTDGRRAQHRPEEGGQKRLKHPTVQGESQTYFGTQRTQTWLRERARGHAWDRGPMGK